MHVMTLDPPKIAHLTLSHILLPALPHQVVIHSGYKYLILPDSEEKKNFTRFDEVAWSPVLPDASPDLKNSSDNSMPLVHEQDITLKLLCSYVK
jgi:hypothetical protein